MSEFYENDGENVYEIFKMKYYRIKNILNNFLINDLLNNDLLNNENKINIEDKNDYLTICNIMDLVLIFHNFYLCHDNSLLLSAHEIIEKYHTMKPLEILKEVNHIYITVLIFIKTYESLVVYDSIIQNILDFSNYYYIYCDKNSQNMIQMIELEEKLENINI